MSLRLYMDHHVSRAITKGLRRRGVDVITAQDDGATTTPDPALLDRATALDRVLVTRDIDLLHEAGRRQQSGMVFAGVIYAHEMKVSVGQCVKDLEIIAKASDPVDLVNQVMYLPL